MKKEGGLRKREDNCGSYRGLLIWIGIKKIILLGGGARIGSLATQSGVLDDEFDEFLAAWKLSKFWSWYKNLGLHVQTHRDNSITWIGFDEAFDPLQWAHLPRHQIIGENNCPAWVCRPTCVWVDSQVEIIFNWI